MCFDHRNLQKELVSKQKHDQEEIDVLRRTIEKTHQQGFEGQNTTHREKAAEINTLQDKIESVKKELQFETDKLNYLDKQVGPVKIGIQQIVAQFQTRPLNLNKIHEIENALEYVERDIVRHISDMKSISIQDDSAMQTETAHKDVVRILFRYYVHQKFILSRCLLMWTRMDSSRR